MIIEQDQSLPGFVKVGKTRDCKEEICRLGSLQIGNPRELAVWRLTNSHDWKVICRAEKVVHSWLTPQHRRGEWFEILPDHAWTVIGQVIDRIEQGLPIDPAVASNTSAAAFKAHKTRALRRRRSLPIDESELFFGAFTREK